MVRLWAVVCFTVMCVSMVGGRIHPSVGRPDHSAMKRKLRSSTNEEETERSNSRDQPCRGGFSGGGGQPGNLHNPGNGLGRQPPPNPGSGTFGSGSSHGGPYDDMPQEDNGQGGMGGFSGGGVGGGGGGGGGQVDPERDPDFWECQDYEDLIPTLSPAPSALHPPSAPHIAPPASSPVTEPPLDDGDDDDDMGSLVIARLYFSVSVAVEPSERRVLEGDLLHDVAGVMTSIANASTPYLFIGARRRLQDGQGTVLELNVEESHSEMSNLSSSSNRTWWEFTIFYELHSSNENETVVENTIWAALTDSIRSGEFLSELQEHADSVIDVALPGHESIVGTPFFPPENDRAPDLEVSTWDARRWVGLGLFSFTLLLTLVLTRTARSRRKKWDEQETWGIRLATDHDINELLTYGWQQDGQQLTLFDKSKVVYKDDDSMLIGGVLYPREITSPSSATS